MQSRLWVEQGLARLLGERGVERKEAPGATAETEARVVESAITGGGWQYRQTTYGTKVVEVARIVASGIPAVNRTTLLG